MCNILPARREKSDYSLTMLYALLCVLCCIFPSQDDAEVRSCDLEVNKPTWTVNGTCDVTKVYSSAGRYGYVIYRRHTYNMTTKSLTITGSVNVTGSLTSFSETSSGNVYYRGRVPFTVPLHSEVGEVTYSVKVTPGTVTKNINHSVTIEPPSQPEHTNCNQGTFLEGGKAPASPCECRVTSLGSPSGRLQWMADDVMLVSGEYGVTRLLFPYDKVTRAHDGRDMLCQVDWVTKTRSTSFRAQITYGPRRVDIHVHEPTNNNDDVNMTIICEPYDVKAGSSVVTAWGGLCQGQQGRRCTLTPPMAEHCGKEVTCTATNQNFPEMQATARWSVKSDYCKAEMISSKDSLAVGVGIGVGVTLVVVMAVVAVMLLVLWRRGVLSAFQCCVPTYDMPSKKRQKEEEEQRNYTDLSNYEIVEGPSGSSSAARDKASRRAKRKESEQVYVNTEAL